MPRHWSGVEVGEYFHLDFQFDPSVYCESVVNVPFMRSAPHGYPVCMVTEVEYAVQSRAGDSAYHVRLALTSKVAPPLIICRTSPAPKAEWSRTKPPEHQGQCPCP